TTRATTGVRRLPHERPSGGRGSTALVLLLLWSLAAFGGRSSATAIPFGLACVLCAVLVKPELARRGAARALDCIVLALGLVILIQGIPLSSMLAEGLSPHARVVRGELSLQQAGASWAPLSIDESSTLWA